MKYLIWRLTGISPPRGTLNAQLCKPAAVKLLTARRNVNPNVLFLNEVLHGAVNCYQMLHDVKIKKSNDRLRQFTQLVCNMPKSLLPESSLLFPLVKLVHRLFRNTKLREKIFNFNVNISISFIHSCIIKCNFRGLVDIW